MKQVFFLLIGLIVIAFYSCDNASNTSEINIPTFNRTPIEIISANGTDVPVYDYENFEPFLSREDNKIHIINFWATWCIPCVAELPYFEQLGQKYPGVEITLVSLDFINLVESKLIPFIQENNLQSEVILLREVDFNSWMPKVSEDWSGAIPATVIYKNNKRVFYEQSFNFEALEEAMKKIET